MADAGGLGSGGTSGHDDHARHCDFEAYRTRIEPIFLKERDGPAGKVTCAGCHSGIATRLQARGTAGAGRDVDG